jgi:hypothetical protein
MFDNVSVRQLGFRHFNVRQFWSRRIGFRHRVVAPIEHVRTRCVTQSNQRDHPSDLATARKTCKSINVGAKIWKGNAFFSKFTSDAFQNTFPAFFSAKVLITPIHSTSFSPPWAGLSAGSYYTNCLSLSGDSVQKQTSEWYPSTYQYIHSYIPNHQILLFYNSGSHF